MPESVRLLRSPATIRARARRVLQAGLRGELRHFAVDEPRLHEAARFTADVTRRRYPTLQIPPHSRFGHFDAGGVQRNAAVQRALSHVSPRERARCLTDLVVTSVLLDAGAGSAWRYLEHDTSMILGRSEGLAIASLDWVKAGGLSSHGTPYEVDAEGLLRVDADQLARAFQVTESNPLVGLEGRAQLLRSLGGALRERADVFGSDGRLGGMIDIWCERASLLPRDPETTTASLPAAEILALVLDSLGSIWPGRLTLEGHPLGDVWRHPAAGGDGITAGLLPLHKLSQWLSYSLIHPLHAAGVQVTELDALTGLAEYRNGGLLIDLGVLVPKHAEVGSVAHEVGSELIVEWRALTVALLDCLAPLVREQLAVDAQQLPLAAMLEGGTWAAGRELAQAKRPGGDPPIRVQSDGTVF